jgi:hypothetical protein
MSPLEWQADLLQVEGGLPGRCLEQPWQDDRATCLADVSLLQVSNQWLLGPAQPMEAHPVQEEE